jgi:hypothetical protein
MSCKRNTALALAVGGLTLAASGPASAMPAGPDPVGGQTPAPVVVSSPATPLGDAGGLGTLTVVLLSGGALVAGAAAGFGGARVSVRRTTLQPR